ncbi:MAG TPA: LysR family transcriptional regulator [Crenalkalicoccus sp.]|jgi:LysR family transcriptional regulator for bpeEF and oprC|nr:LysR family transcriptional regulator [Crenalkalicoccus sp.]
MDRLLAMEAFVRTVDTGSMSRAAEQLGIANASVTILIRKLEAHLGVTLLQRSTRYVRLSDEGTGYYERCRSILDQIREAEATVADRELGPRGMLRLETPIAVGHLVLGPALAEFSRRYPNLRVITSLNNEVDNLIKRGIDVAIRMEAVESGDLVARLIYRARYIACAARAFLEAHGRPSHPQEIDPKHCLGFAGSPSGDLRIWHFRRGEERQDVTPAFNSTDALMQAAVHGAGLIYVLDVLAEQHCRGGELARVLPDWETDGQTFFAVYTKTGFTPPKIRAFVDFLASHFAVPADHAPVPIRAR